MFGQPGSSDYSALHKADILSKLLFETLLQKHNYKWHLRLLKSFWTKNLIFCIHSYTEAHNFWKFSIISML